MNPMLPPVLVPAILVGSVAILFAQPAMFLFVLGVTALALISTAHA